MDPTDDKVLLTASQEPITPHMLDEEPTNGPGTNEPPALIVTSPSVPSFETKDDIPLQPESADDSSDNKNDEGLDTAKIKSEERTPNLTDNVLGDREQIEGGTEVSPDSTTVDHKLVMEEMLEGSFDKDNEKDRRPEDFVFVGNEDSVSNTSSTNDQLQNLKSEPDVASSTETTSHVLDKDETGTQVTSSSEFAEPKVEEIEKNMKGESERIDTASTDFELPQQTEETRLPTDDVQEKEKNANVSVNSFNLNGSSTETIEDANSPGAPKEDVVKVPKPEPPEWIDILGNGLLQKKVLVAGKGKETRPVNGQEVTLSVKGKLSDGTQVDCYDELVFQLGDEDVIVALELGVSLMEDGEKAIIKTNSKYAFGKFGRPDFDPPIPQNADIEYELEILSINNGKEIGSLNDDERYVIGDKKRMKGNYLYGLGDYDGAITMYTRGVKYLEGASRKDVADLCIKCWNNLSAAQLKVQAFKPALQSCEMVLRAEPENMKGYFRKGKCLEGIGDLEEALKCLKKASMLDPQNKMILQELGRLKARVVKSQKKEREMYQRMMQGSGKSQEEDTDESSGSWLPYIIGAAAIATGGILIKILLNRSH